MQTTYDDQGNAYVYGPDGNPLDPERAVRLLNNITADIRESAHTLALYEDGGTPDLQEQQRETERLQAEAEALEGENRRRDIRDDAAQHYPKDADAVSRVVDAELWRLDKNAAFDKAREQYPDMFFPRPGEGRTAKEAAQEAHREQERTGFIDRLLSRRG